MGGNPATSSKEWQAQTSKPATLRRVTIKPPQHAWKQKSCEQILAGKQGPVIKGKSIKIAGQNRPGYLRAY